MPAGYVDLEVRYLDPDTGEGIAMDFVSGTVRNALGEVQTENLVPFPIVDDDGVLYRFPNFDVSRPAIFPGTWLTVEWKANRFGVGIPTFLKRYEFAPASKYANAATVVYWPASASPGILFYEVKRIRGADDDPVLVGRTFGNSIVDRTVFGSEFEARSWRYQAWAAVQVQGPLRPDGSDYTIQDVSAAPKSYRIDKPVCLVSGRLANIMGMPFYSNVDYTKTQVIFRQYEKDRHQMLGDLYVAPEAVHLNVTEQGNFSVVLLQDVLAEIWVPMTRFRARFVVPRKEEATLADLNLQVLHE